MKLSHQTLFKLQQYKPGYTAPRQLFHYTGISMNFRYFYSSCFDILLCSSAQCSNCIENHSLCWKRPRSDWGIEELDLRNPYFLTWDATGDHDLYSFHSPTSLICCRVIALLVCFFPPSLKTYRSKILIEHTIIFSSSFAVRSSALLAPFSSSFTRRSRWFLVNFAYGKAR